MNLPKIYSQNDAQWRNKILGQNYTIGNAGCLITCIAMMLCYFGHEETPATLDDRLDNNNIGGYSGDLFNWGSVTRLYSDVKYQGQTQTPDKLTTAQMNAIRSKIDAGYPVILQIDTIPSTAALDEHWILAIGYEGDDFIVADPWDGSIKRITSWGVAPQTLIWAYANYTGTPVQQTQTITIDQLLYEHLVNGATVRKEVAQYLEISDPDNASKDDIIRVIAGLKSRATDLQKQLIDTQTELTNRTEQVSRLKAQLTEEESLAKELQNKVNDIVKSQQGIEGVYESRIRDLQDKVDTLAKEKGELNNQIAELKKKNASSGEIEVSNILVRLWEKIKTWKI